MFEENSKLISLHFFEGSFFLCILEISKSDSSLEAFGI